MTRAFMIGIVVVAVGAGAALTAQAPRGGELQMKAAQHKADVEGDLNGAIEDYKKIVANAGSNRSLAAQALVRMAECYQKLGDAEAQTIYERIFREFADQTNQAALARARLGPTKSDLATSMQTRWSGPDVNTEGTVSPDGRYLSYSDRQTGDLSVRDLLAGTSRRLTAAPGDFTDWAEFSTISRDGRQIAYAWFVHAKERYELRILPTHATPQTTPRTMTDNPELSDVYPYDWSPDGAWIAVRVSRPDKTAQIGLVATRDLSLTVLKSVDWRGPTKMFFSPDGRYLAYDLPVGDSSLQRDVFVIGVDGGRDSAAVAHSSYDVVMGWSNDGRWLLFASNRSGAMDLWKVAMTYGKPSGAAVLVRPNLGPVNASLGVTKTGSLVVGLQTGGPNVFTAAIDLSTGKLVDSPKPVVDGYLQANRQPAWSHDGKSIVYLSNRSIGPSHLLSGTSFLVIQSFDTGRTTELQPLLSWFLNPHFAPDGSITVGGSDLKGRRGIFRIDPEKGAVTEIVSGPPGTCTNGNSWSSDGMTFAYRLGCSSNQIIIVRDMRSGQERQVARGTDLAGPSISADGRRIAYVSRDSTTKSNALAIIQADGGSPKSVLRVTDGITLGDRISWTPDGRRLIVTRIAGGKPAPIAVSVDDGTSMPLDPRLPWSMAVHPDGRRVVFSDGETAHEVRTIGIAPESARR